MAVGPKPFIRMIYNKIVEATFTERPNRFIAHCMVKDQIEVVHVKNTGKCKELLVNGATVYLEENDLPHRKTKFSLIAVEKGKRLINMDSQAPNKVVMEALASNRISLPGLNEEIKHIQSEKVYKKSRFDIYLETESKKVFIEVKGVTLEEDDAVRFPDAKTERGLKHVLELVDAKKEGYHTYIIFVIQMKNVKFFTPNDELHKAFGDALRVAKQRGVKIVAFDSIITPNSIELSEEVPVRL